MDKTFDVQCELTYVPDYPSLYNDPEQTEFVKNSLESMNDKEIKKGSRISGFFRFRRFFVLCRKDTRLLLAVNRKGWRRHFNHHPKFGIDEDALLIASKSVAQVVCRFYEWN